MKYLFVNVEDSIIFKNGDIIVHKSKNLLHDGDFYIVDSNYAYYAYDVNGDNTQYDFKTIHSDNFDYRDVFMFGSWKVKCKSIETGKYKTFEQDSIISIENTYLKSCPSKMRDIKLKCLI